MMGTLRLYVECRRAGARGLLFDGYMNKPAPDGWRIISNSLAPLLDAARVLESKGINGKLEMWNADGTTLRMTGDISRLAKWTVSDGGHSPLSFRRWRPAEGKEDLPTPQVLDRIKAEVAGLVLAPDALEVAA